MFKRLVQRARSTPPLDRGAATNTIQAPHIPSRIMRRLGIREMAPAPELAREVQPVIIVDDLSTDPALDTKESYWIGNHLFVPTAGQFAGIGLRNSSEHDAVTVEGVFTNLVAGTSITVLRAGILAGASLAATAFIESRTDSLAAAARSGNAEIWEVSLGALPTGPYRVRVGGTTQPEVALNWSIPPQLWLWIIVGAVTTTIDAGFRWKESRARE